MTTLKAPLLTSNSRQGNGSVELKIGQEYDDDNFEVLTDDISFTSKVRLLLWKNCMIQCRRRPKSCCVKCCIPLFIMFVMVSLTWISTLQPHENSNAYGLEFDYIISNTGDSADFTELYPMNDVLPWPDSTANANQWIKYIICDPNRVTSSDGKDVNPPSYLAIVAENYETNENVQSILSILNQNYGTNDYLTQFQNNTVESNTWYTYQYFMNQSQDTSMTDMPQMNEEFVYTNCYLQSPDTTFVNFTNGSLLKFFETEQEMDDYITDSKYGNTGYNFNNTESGSTRPIGAAIVFDVAGGDDGMTWEYTLRFNSSVIPATATNIDKFTRNIDQLYYGSAAQYLEFSGFIQLQNWLDQAIMEYMVNISDGSMDALNAMTREYSKGLFMFPTQSYQESTYWNYIGQVFPFILFIMFCYPIITVLSILIEEKQSKIKEGMKMMGATTTAYWTSWFIFFFIEFTMIAVLVTLLGIGGNVFRYSDSFIIFLWFELFCLSSAAFAMMVSTLFDNPKSGSLFGFIIYFAVLIGGQFSGNLDASGKTGLCILAPSCFVTSTPTLVQYEVSVIGLTFDNIYDTYNDFQFVTCLIMMAVDIVIYSILTLYLDQVWPSAYGQKQPFYFFVMPSFWFGKLNCFKSEQELENEHRALIRRLSSVNNVENYEKIGNLNGEATINIRNLTKTFTSYSVTNGKKEVRAVRGVSLDMYKGEVFCLLGHNGAGKTTTIGMLTGLLDATDGSAFILQNDVTNPNTMSQIRRNLGVCPQHDVLWSKLTAREHLWLFARLKGVAQNRVDKEVDQILQNTGLISDNNSDKFPPQMSGGQRRKLSLGIALIGGSQICFLDEPTSGMDPQSRRITWDLISKEKKNRCIILTTHFMDEADILGDTIAIMSNGQISCCGSSLYLKQTYGVGYTFTVSLEANDEIVKEIDQIKKKIDTFVFDTISGAKSVSLAGSELTYRLPFEETGSFSKLFDILDETQDELYIKSYGISVTTLEEVFLKIGHDGEEYDALSSNDEDFRDERSVNNIGMDAKNKLEAQNQFKQPTISSFALQEQSSFQIFFIHVYAVLYKRFWWSLRDFKALLCSLFCPVLLSGMALGLLTIQIATNEPFLQLSTTNWNSNVDNVMIPIANNTNYSFPVNGSYFPIPDNFYENKSFYNAFVNYVQSDMGNIDLVNTSITPNSVFEKNDTDYNGKKLENLYFKLYYDVSIGVYPSYYNITKTFQDWLLEAENQYYNAFLFMPYSMTPNTQKHVYFGCNGSALHSLPITLNVWNNWVIRDVLQSSSPSITVNNHPLPVTTRQNLIGTTLTGFATTTYLVIAFSFIPAGAIYFIVNEKAMNTKHQQLVSGISFSAYWVANFIADFVIGLPASLLVFASIFVFDTTTYEGAAAVPFLLIMVIFLFAALPFTYLLSFLFKSPSKAQLTTILLFIITGIILATVAFILDLIDSTRDVNDKLKGIYRIFPIYLMTESLFNVSAQSLLSDANKNYYAWDVCSRNWVLMVVEGFGYFAAVLFLEYLSSFPVLLSKLGFVTNRPLTETDDELDIDVLNEKKRILSGLKYINDGSGMDEKDSHSSIEVDKNRLEDTVVIAGLRKVYDPAGTSRIVPCCSNVGDEDKIEAVKNLYFGVKQSEVFGFLGVNGAGKTTTLATLTGERYPSAGNAFIANFPISNQLQCRRYVGYCPQFDAIFDLLTAREHLKFYAMIKGLSGREADEQVKVLLNALTLNKYKNRVAGTYSGGNKRKLSVAVSMIGNPPVIFLDEPSTGMDPVSRRFMWEFISTTMAGRCVILTTHSMEECEALCNRVGIMVNGQLKCIGTAQHLKSRYGKGYQLDITLTPDTDDEKDLVILQNELENNFGSVTMIEHNGNRISFELVKNHQNTMKLGRMFNILEDIKVNKLSDVIQAYALSQTTLEQIFIRMAKQGQVKDKQ